MFEIDVRLGPSQVCAMLGALENYYWRYTSASELVNMILAFIETRAAQVRLIDPLRRPDRGTQA